MSFLNKIPNWLRWSLFLPLSFLALIIVFAVVSIGNRLTMIWVGRSLYSQIAIWVLSNLWSAASFVWVGATIVPNKNFSISVLMAVLFGFLMGAMVISKCMLGSASSVSWLETIIACISGGIGAIGTVYYFHEKNYE